MLIALVGQHALRAAQVAEEGIKMARLHAGHAVRADLLLIDQQAQVGVRRRLGGVDQRGGRRIGTDAVVVAVGADERAVKPDIAGVERGDP